MKDIYTQNGRVRGKCSVCGDTKTYKQTRQPKYFKPYYFRVFEKVNWFRGDDEYLGVVCKACIKAGDIGKVNKLESERLTSRKLANKNIERKQ